MGHRRSSSFITILWTIPTLGLLVTSLRPAGGGQQHRLVDRVQPTRSSRCDNYNEVLNGGDTIPGGIAPYFINSFVISIPAAIIPLVLALMAAYALAWVPFRFSNAVFLADLRAAGRAAADGAAARCSQLFNKGWGFGMPSRSIPPIKDVPILGTSLASSGGASFVPLWIAHTMFALPLAIFLIHNFISQLPQGPLRGGARRRRQPLPHLHAGSCCRCRCRRSRRSRSSSSSGCGTTCSSVSRSPEARSTSHRSRSYLSNIKGTYGAQLHLITAGAFIAIIVPLCVFFALQRFFVRGLLAGSVKG